MLHPPHSVLILHQFHTYFTLSAQSVTHPHSLKIREPSHWIGIGTEWIGIRTLGCDQVRGDGQGGWGATVAAGKAYLGNPTPRIQLSVRSSVRPSLFVTSITHTLHNRYIPASCIFASCDKYHVYKHHAYICIYGSVSAGRGKCLFRVIFFQKVERSCDST